MVWPALLVSVLVSAGSALISYALMKAPKDVENDSRNNLPVAEDGKVICVVFGKRRIKNVNTLWYGDISTHEIIDNGGK